MQSNAISRLARLPTPFTDKDRESKTWLSEQEGPITDVRMLLARAPYFAPAFEHEQMQAAALLGLS